jgi:hypothetical protein
MKTLQTEIVRGITLGLIAVVALVSAGFGFKTTSAYDADTTGPVVQSNSADEIDSLVSPNAPKKQADENDPQPNTPTPTVGPDEGNLMLPNVSAGLGSSNGGTKATSTDNNGGNTNTDTNTDTDDSDDDEGSSRRSITRRVVPVGPGEVLGASTEDLAADCSLVGNYLRVNSENSEADMIRLQYFLQGAGYEVGLSGAFDDATFAAVKQFQTRYASEILAPWGPDVTATGYVYIYTKKKINDLFCAAH